MERLAVIVAALVFGPVLIGAFFTAVGPALLQLFQYIFWLIVAVGAAIGMWALGRLFLIQTAEERLREEQRADLLALHQRIVEEHKRIWDEEHEMDQTIAEHQRALDAQFLAITGS